MDRGRDLIQYEPLFLCPLSLSLSCILNFFLLLKSRNDCNGKKEREGFIIERRIVIGRIERWKMTDCWFIISVTIGLFLKRERGGGKQRGLTQWKNWLHQ